MQTNILVVNVLTFDGPVELDSNEDFRRRRTQPSLRRLIKIRVNRSAKTVATVRSALVPGFKPDVFRRWSKLRRIGSASSGFPYVWKLL